MIKMENNFNPEDIMDNMMGNKAKEMTTSNNSFEELTKEAMEEAFAELLEKKKKHTQEIEDMVLRYATEEYQGDLDRDKIMTFVESVCDPGTDVTIFMTRETVDKIYDEPLEINNSIDNLDFVRLDNNVDITIDNDNKMVNDDQILILYNDQASQIMNHGHQVWDDYINNELGFEVE